MTLHGGQKMKRTNCWIPVSVRKPPVGRDVPCMVVGCDTPRMLRLSPTELNADTFEWLYYDEEEFEGVGLPFYAVEAWFELPIYEKSK